MRFTETGAEDFFVRPYESLGGTYRFFSSLDEAERFFFAEKDRLGEFSALKNRLTECVKKEEKKVEKRLKIIAEKELDCAGLERDKEKGDLILSNLWRIKKGDAALACENFFAENARKK